MGMSVTQRSGAGDCDGKRKRLCMANKLKRMAYKLQTALLKKGVYVRINQYQSYSEKSDRMVTKYVLSKKEKTENGKGKNVTILETYQIVDVVKKLAELYGDSA